MFEELSLEEEIFSAVLHSACRDRCVRVPVSVSKSERSSAKMGRFSADESTAVAVRGKQATDPDARAVCASGAWHS